MDINKKNILIVDDNEINRILLSEMLLDEFNIIEAQDGEEAINILSDRADDITLILLDLIMPKINGFGVLAAMNAFGWIEKIPVIMVSSESSAQYLQKAFDLGAVEYINRPFDSLTLHKRIINTIIASAKQQALQDFANEQILLRNKESQVMISIFSHIVEIRNGESGQHVKNINVLTELILNRLLSITEKYNAVSADVHVIKTASSLHDIGKTAIPDYILNKPGKLTPAEFAVMKTHSTLGAEMISTVEDYQEEPIVKYAYEIARWHHERYDGNGYPDGLKGDDIPISAQVVSLADVYDALISKRCYKDAFSHEDAIKMILNGECGQFNPLLLDCLVSLGDTLKTNLNK